MATLRDVESVDCSAERLDVMMAVSRVVWMVEKLDD